MIKMKQLILAGAVALSLSDAGLAQDASPRPPGGATPHFSALVNQALGPDALPEPLPIQPNPGIGGGVLQALPRPLDLPGSLYAPPPPPSTGYLRVDAPYLIPDPLLDFTPSAPPGWFTGVEVQIIKTHVIPGLSNLVTPGQHISNSPIAGPPTGNQQLVSIPSAALNWTASPKVFVGYRLPSGFGEFMASYRYLGTGGSGPYTPSPNNRFALSSRAALNIIDFDYNSRELSLGPLWDMKWTLGLRNLTLFYDSRATQPSAQAAAGNGILQERNFNNLYGIGPHVALELSRHLGNSRWSLYTRGDFGATFDYTNQEYYTRSRTPGTNGPTQYGQSNTFGHQATPMINGRVGLTWRPSPTSGSRLFVGYQYEYFWDLARLPQTTGSPVVPASMGQLFDQGIVLQATFRY